jgi:murein DD-endopeptidase MepM/ murein hydrolase activator NlpD
MNGRFAVRVFSSRFIRVFALTVIVFAGIAAPSRGDNLNQQISEASAALIKATKEVESTQKALAKTKAKVPAVRAKLTAARAKEATARAAYLDAKAKSDSARAQYKTAIAKLNAKKLEIKRLQIKVDQFARSVYQQGQTSQWEIILQSQSPSDLTSRLQTIKSVSQASARSLANLEDAKAQLIVVADEAKVVKIEMDRLAGVASDALGQAQSATDDAENAKANLDGLIAEEKRDLGKAEKSMAAQQRELDKLVAEQIRISQISNSGSQGDGDPQATGGLITTWPVPGYAAGQGDVYNAGPRILNKGTNHQRYSCHTGQDVPAPTGADAVADGAGIILESRYYSGYGNVIMIDHGQGLVSVYAHLSRRLVDKGEAVSSGMHIGDVGDTGYFSQGSHLHFEIHLNGYNYDPMGWFGGSKSLIACAPKRSIG